MAYQERVFTEQSLFLHTGLIHVSSMARWRGECCTCKSPAVSCQHWSHHQTLCSQFHFDCIIDEMDSGRFKYCICNKCSQQASRHYISRKCYIWKINRRSIMSTSAKASRLSRLFFCGLYTQYFGMIHQMRKLIFYSTLLKRLIFCIIVWFNYYNLLLYQAWNPMVLFECDHFSCYVLVVVVLYRSTIFTVKDLTTSLEKKKCC